MKTIKVLDPNLHITSISKEHPKFEYVGAGVYVVDDETAKSLIEANFAQEMPSQNSEKEKETTT